MSQSELSDQCNRLIEKSTNRKILFTLRAWPVIALATIGLCYLTQIIAGWFGITLTEQSNVELVKAMAGWNLRFIINLALILLILPIVEELVFRGLIYRLPVRIAKRSVAWVFAVVSSVLFAAAHYLAQPWPDNAFLALAFFGLAQCWLYRKTDRIWCPMLNHSLFNLTNLILLFTIVEQGGTP